ncbi:ABC transporter permease [Sphingosinicella sp. YJ22]|uniref:ABC transporter permease n=1 Tax=Sphingosinicella sp. YJ22 TaxID=1104780 RepID=UPI0014085800|nr:ABC transporter permease [Sphingosinicella sp. YJ22]
MWRNYAIVGLRALAKNRTYAFINIFGLAIGLAACLMLLLYVRYERSYDSWLPNAENVYQIQSSFRDPNTGEEGLLQMSPYVAGRTMAADFPQIDKKVYALSASPVVSLNGEALPTEHVVYVDGNLFDILQVPFVQGDPRRALNDAGSVVLSETEARRYFGESNPIGRTLTLIARGQSTDHRVTGVMRDLPRNSHQRLDMVVRFDPQTYFAETPDFLTQWGANSGWTYVTLRPGTDPAAINDNLGPWEERNIPDQQFGDQMLNQGDFADWRLVNVRDIHLGTSQGGAVTAGNDERTILTFTVVAFLILGMACINFTNLATARASARAREVALRKVLGASRSQLMTQFLMESVLVAGFAMLLALAMAELLLPALGRFLDADLAMTYVGADGMLLPIVLLTVLVGAAGGVYPAIYLSRFQPAQVLKANKSTAEASGSGVLRSALVIGQFAVSIGLIICTAVVYGQTVYARTADPGFQREGLLQVEGLNRRQIIDRSEAIAREIARVPGVRSVARTGIGIDPQNQVGTVIQVPGRHIPVGMGSYLVDESFFRTLGAPILAGRELSANREMDVVPLPLFPTPEQERAFAARGINVVINERAARDLGFSNPSEAVGAQLRMGLVRPENGLVPITIVGLVKDTRLRSIREPLEPIAFALGTSGFTTLVVRYEDPEPNAVRERVEQVWRRLAPDVPFEAEFSDDIVAELYQGEEARARVFAGFAALAVIVACLGLFGLAAFTAERRTKEIGIRKVLGARTRDIVRLLAWQFSKPVIIANLIAWPTAWWAMRDWLNTFDTRVDLGVTPFLLAGLLALAIAIGTIAGHALRVARANPIHALRYE